MLAIGALIGFIGVFLWWSRTPRWLNEPYLHYASEQWRELRSGDLFDREARKIVGTAMLDCGRVPVKGVATEVNECVRRAWASRRPFKARWELLGIDAHVEDGLLGTSDGRLYRIQYLEGPFVPAYRRVNVYECSKPAVIKEDSVTNTLDCAGKAVDVPAFAIAVKLSPRAEERLRTIGERIEMLAMFDGDALPGQGRYNPPARDVSLGSIEKPVGRGNLVQFENIQVPQERFDRLADKDFFVTINTFTARKADRNNLLDCTDPTDVRIDTLKGKTTEIRCWLIGESGAPNQ